MEHKHLVEPANQRNLSEWSRGTSLNKRKSSFHPFSPTIFAILRSAFQISTWVLLGACAQGLLLTFHPKAAWVALPFIILGWRSFDAMLRSFGLKKNPRMNEIIPGKFAVHFPNESGKFEGEPANTEICAIILSARSNHPLGAFAPGFIELFDLFDANVAELEKYPEKYGWLGSSSLYLSAGERYTAPQALIVVYFKNVECLHKFAHEEIHRHAWNWWNSTYQKHPYLSIMHEVYMVPKGGWEGIYINSHPTLLAATSVAVSNVGGDTASKSPQSWIRPIVDASKGIWRSSAGRMNRGDGGEHDQDLGNPYTD